MFFLKKLFEAREGISKRRSSQWEDVEKPFLEHLEDLRVMMTKSLITLLGAMIVCFIFSEHLLEAVRYPIKLAGLDSIDGNKLPKERIDRADWGKIREMARVASGLDGRARDAYLDRVPGGKRAAVEAAALFRAAVSLPVEERPGFVQTATEDPEVLEIALFLVNENPDARHKRTEGDFLRMSALKPPETFALSLKLSFFAGLGLSFPLLLYFLAEFVLPGLTPQERKLVLPSVAVGFALFLIGVLFCFFVVVPGALKFFHEYSLRYGVEDEWRIGYYVSFVTQVTLIFGLCFELPVVVMALVKLGLLDYRKMSGSRTYAVLAIFVVAALITPTTDAFTLFLLAGPMLLLYEICIWLSLLIERKERAREEEEEEEWRSRSLHPAIEAEDAPDPLAAPGTVARPEEEDDIEEDTWPEDDPYMNDSDYDYKGETDEEDSGSGGDEEDGTEGGSDEDERPWYKPEGATPEPGSGDTDTETDAGPRDAAGEEDPGEPDAPEKDADPDEGAPESPEDPDEENPTEQERKP